MSRGGRSPSKPPAERHFRTSGVLAALFVTGDLNSRGGQRNQRPMRMWFRQRYLDLLGSIYIYNEHRGYTAVDDLLTAVRTRC